MSPRLRSGLRIAAFFVAAVVLVLTFVNASWLAPAPVGALRMVAHRGVAQQFDRAGVGNDSCTASRIAPPVHGFVENTIPSIDSARRLGADMVEVDIAPTADGGLALFHDWRLECRTDGRGPVRGATLAQLKRLDPGFGYTADGGRTFPLRGKGLRIPDLPEVLTAFPATAFMFNFKSDDPAEADRLAAALKASGRHVALLRDAFYGADGPVRRIRQHYPEAWAWSLSEAKACTKAYMLTGWTSVVPAVCHNRTIIVPINRSWLAWGWPNRFLARMRASNTRVIVTGPHRPGQPNRGLWLPEELGRIPQSFKGFVWVEDMWTVGPSFRPQRDYRTQAQIDAANRGLEFRRGLD